MEPTAVVIKGTDHTIGYLCSHCKVTHFPQHVLWRQEAQEQLKGKKPSHDEAMRLCFESARDCCFLRCSNQNCNKLLVKGRDHHTYFRGGLFCDSCLEFQKAFWETKLVETAIKIPLSEYKFERVYVEETEEFVEPCDLATHCAENEIHPDFVYGAKLINLELDAGWILEMELENFHEGAFDSIPDGMVGRLQTYLNLWCKKAGVSSFLQDREIVIPLKGDREFQKELRREMMES